MLNVKLICLGKLKEDYLRQACAEYAKRLAAFCKPEIIELTPARLPEKPSAAQIEAALAAEARLIAAKIPRDAAVCSLCVEGRQVSSEELAKQIECFSMAAGCAVFIIGSSYGLDPTIKERSALKLSMSRMTFPHQLARVMLLEQLYRAFEISSGGKYHK